MSESETASESGSAREEVLARVRAALGEDRPLPVIARSTDREIPTASSAQVVDLFVERVEDYRASVVRVQPGGLAAAVAEALGDAGRVVVPDGVESGWLSKVDPSRVVSDSGLSAAELDRIDAVLTGAAVGIAVTGTIVLDHGPSQGRRALSLVPDLHVCVIGESQLVPDVPDAIAHLAPAEDARRPMTWISGPSATSDIELERVEGVHGPRTLHVILVGE